MAFFGNSPQGRPSGGGQGGATTEDRLDAGEPKGGPSSHEPSQVSSPKFQPGMPVKPQTGAFRPEPPMVGRADGLKAPAPAAPEAESAPPTLSPPKPGTVATRESGETKNLIVGSGIQLNGQISACDRLVVEGTVEADLNDAEAIEVTASGLFKGTASIQEADISGRFEGNLIVKRRLTLRNGGRINGSVQYAALVIEEGGEIRGQMDVIGGGESAGPGA
ncbi:polymer-forming cytoskeletal protein [Roseospira marina]|uniref:Polymer-forming cytoskeletal protein n=1 Tax=Roseospira marina TaxID=140057 RepID=A0A5M6IB81_9PROT|nr:polymer-forming cytoskeletal protein [Roseospira marina]KAA5605491.1 polymer-forming cytoskeletal protein [Roseospira marina]MBB4314506.1 cytoskeletal protein CcmA (bactofilin family) [Roseospira marina]MBB5088666.1 cytoskeletal protein CcmA (bactofilin family) [Roseospira marina]